MTLLSPAPVFSFGTKAQTLESLSALLSKGVLCPQLIVEVSDWIENSRAVVDLIIDHFGSTELIFRSSSEREDTATHSNAGAFASVTHVPTDEESISSAVREVIESYGADCRDQHILVQPMVQDVSLSGVVFTRDLDTGAPYYVINYDDLSGRTDTVTGGAISKTVAVHRTNPEALRSPRMRKLIEAIQEIEAVTGFSELDIEFCITSDDVVTILQVRPQTMLHKWQMVDDSIIDQEVLSIRDYLDAKLAKQPGVCGSTTILGEMPDWNPAEMIGSAPRPLALSLYKYLITDRTWSQARSAMGYRSVDEPLLIALAGRPYIDVRLSLNSFVPAALDDELVEQLVNWQLERLAESKELHDKIEFEISITCRDLNFDEHRKRLIAECLSSGDVEKFENALTGLTANAIGAGTKNLLNILHQSGQTANDFNTYESYPALERARLMLKDCIPFGTLPFSILARHGFIAIAMLRSIVSLGILSVEESQRFLNGIHTVASDIVKEIGDAASGEIELDDFLSRYGHLRPGTYDILSWRYDEKPELYIGSTNQSPGREFDYSDRFQLSRKQIRQLSAALEEHNLPSDPMNLFDYMDRAIYAREQAKFAFTRYLSDALLALGKWGEEMGLSRQDLSYLTISDIFGSKNDVGYLREKVEVGKACHLVTRAIRLPHLIVEPDDIDVVRDVVGQPTFVTTQSVTSSTVYLSTNISPGLSNRIVLIESADPGFDWIFSHEIAGLVTKYGGSNSHMAIRCAEFGLPAAIGCGEKLFKNLMESSVIELNCAARTITGH